MTKLATALILVLSCAGAERPRKIDSLQELSSSLENLSRTVGNAVVQVYASGYSLTDGSDSSAKGTLKHERDTASGVIISDDGYIITNRHVVANARHVEVRMAPESGVGHSILTRAGRMMPARIVGTDKDTDVAVLKVDRTGLPHLDLGDSDSLRQGQVVIAFGNPLGFQNSVTLGVVSSVARQIKPDDSMVYIQTDAPINPGNSGGPLVDSDGRVMGINAFIMTESGGSEGLGFAIPSNIIRNVYTQIRKSGRVHRGEIGLSAQTITPDLAAALQLPRDCCVLVSDVVPGGPADSAGLKVNDIVLTLDGKPMENARQLDVDMYRYALGQVVHLDVQRGPQRITFPVTVVERSDDPMRFAELVDPARNMVAKLGFLGIDIDRKIASVLPELRNPYGVVVAAHAEGSQYTGDDLRLGDVIYSVNGKAVSNIDALRKAVDNLKQTEPLVLQVQRKGQLLYLTMEAE